MEVVHLRNLRTIPFILILFLVSFPAQAQQWERVSGGEYPGVRILDEQPLCWFSISDDGPIYSIVGSSTIFLSDIKYWIGSYVIEYYANGGNVYPVETHVYDGTYNSLGQVTGFKELRHYQTSGNTYYIEISNVSYNGFGQVMDGYPVNITKNSAIEQQAIDSECSPCGSWSGSMGIGGTVSTCINSSDGSSELCWSIPYLYYGIITTVSDCANGTYTYISPNRYQAVYTGIATESAFETSSGYTLTISGWLDSCENASGYFVINFEPALGWPSSYSGLWFMDHSSLPEKASSPYPADEAIDQPTNLILSWSGSGSETSFNVYFGTDPNLNESDFKSNQFETTYDPSILLYDTTYYWRIDARNAQGTTTGDIWSFTTSENVIAEDISDYISGIYIEQIWDYGDPTDSDDLIYEFCLKIYSYDDQAINMDADVASIEFLTPTGNIFQIPKQPGQWSDDIWTSYEFGEYEYISNFLSAGSTWKYRARFSDITDLQPYGDGEYIIKINLENSGQIQTTAWFGIEYSQYAIPQPTQEPVLTFPYHNQTVESPVTFMWGSCTDTNAAYINLDVDELGTVWLGDKWEDFDVGETHWGPVYMPDGIWEAEIIFDRWLSTMTNIDGILTSATKCSKSIYRFKIEGSPWTMYEVWGGNTWIDLSDGSYGSIADLEANGYIKLGESDGQTATFSGQYQYYLIGTIGEFLLDSIQGSDDSYYSSFEYDCEKSNIINEDYMLGSPDGDCAIVGESNPWDDYSGYFVFTNPGNWEGLTVITSELNLNINKDIKNSSEEFGNIDPNYNITYIINVESNEFVEQVTDLTVVDILPEEVSFVSAEGDEVSGKYDPDTHTYTWLYPSLAPESVIEMRLIVQVKPDVALGTTITNYATINSNETPPTTASADIIYNKVVGGLQIIPDTIRRNGTLTEIMAVLTLPEGTEEKVDSNELLILSPVNQDEIQIRANNDQIVTETDGKTVIVAVFDIARLMEAIPAYGPVKLKVEGKLTSGYTFYGQAIITITRFASN
jgi:hypothetical protein